MCLNTSDVYPPLIKAFKVFKYFSLLPGGKYDFIVKIDLDTYVNADALRKILVQIDSLKAETRYIGVPGYGIPSEREKLGLTKPFCIGFGFILTSRAMHVLADHATDCLSNLAYKHDDTEVFDCCLLVLTSVDHESDWTMSGLIRQHWLWRHDKQTVHVYVLSDPWR